MLNRFLAHDDCFSSFHRSYRKPPLPGLAEFGEKVVSKAQADPSFSPEHMVMSSAGIFKARAIKVMQPSERFSWGSLEISIPVQ